MDDETLEQLKRLGIEMVAISVLVLGGYFITWGITLFL